MKRVRLALFTSLTMLVLFALGTPVQGQKFREVYTGTIVSANAVSRSTGFNLSLSSLTSDEEAMSLLGTLAEGDQFDVLKRVSKLELGRISATGQVGRDILIARKTQLPDGRIRIVVAFERWQRMAEIRGGYRSQDYPFGLMEIILDANGKKGSGTFIAACKIDLKRDKKTGKYQLELENFGTYPHRVMGVMLRK